MMNDPIDLTVDSTSAPNFISLDSLSGAHGAASAVDSPNNGAPGPHAEQVRLCCAAGYAARLCMRQGCSCTDGLTQTLLDVCKLTPCVVMCDQPSVSLNSSFGGNTGPQGGNAEGGSGFAAPQALASEKKLADAAEGLKRLQAYIKSCGARRSFEMQNITCGPLL